MVFEAAQRAGIVLVLAVVLVYVWWLVGRGRWRAVLTDRFVYGVPWGSILSLLLVVLVYLFVQSGIESWSDPVVTPFRSWSYSYVLGLLTAGFTHAGPDHLVSNLLAAAVLSPLVEYAWGHYRPSRADTQADVQYEHPPGDHPEADRSAVDRATDGGSAVGGTLARPAVRAFVLFPAGLVAVSLLTSVFAQGWSLGYSGTVFFLLGVAVVVLPLVTVVAMVGLSGVSVLLSALQTPVLRVTASSGGPSPPSWAGVNVQAHLLGFLLGVLAAFLLLRGRDRWPDVGQVALAVVLVVLSRSLWAYSTASGDTYTRWQGLGVVFVLFLSTLVVAMVALDENRTVGTVRLRSLVVGGLVVVTLLIALVSVPPNLTGMDDDPVPEGPAVEVEDYTVTYAENVPHGRVPVNTSGVIVVSEPRDVWSSVVEPDQLAHSGTATVTVGGIGWREVVAVERTGWSVTGNDTVYTVTLEHDDRRVQAFRSAPKRADSRLAGHTVTVAPTTDGFRLRVSRGGELVGETALPGAGENRTVTLSEPATIDTLTVAGTADGDDVRVVVEHGGTRIPVAERR
jgi:membrane associated rhomboid family serine protease